MTNSTETIDLVRADVAALALYNRDNPGAPLSSWEYAPLSTVLAYRQRVRVVLESYTGVR